MISKGLLFRLIFITFLLKTTEKIDRIRSEGISMERSQVFDSSSLAISKIAELLGINETNLSLVLGVTPKTLSDWKKRQPGELPPKASRLVRLFQVLSYLEKTHPEVPKRELKGLLENGRLIFDPSDEDDGSISLLNFIISEPRALVWAPLVETIVDQYKSWHRGYREAR